MFIMARSKDKQFKLFNDSENGKDLASTLQKEFTELLPKLALIKKYTDEELILMCYSIFNEIGNQRNVFKQHKIENSLLNVFKNVYQD